MFTFCSTFNKVGRANKIMRSFIFRRLLLKARWKNLNKIVPPDLSSVSNGPTSESNWCSLLEMNWLFLGNMKKLYSNGSTFLSSNRFMQTKVRKKVMTGNQPGSQKKKARLD